MVSSKAVIGFLAVSTLALLPSGAWAWGGEGHRIIALIAADRLTPAARAEVSDLLGGDARGSMEEVSTWADDIRRDRPETAPWHYVNIEISANGYDAARDCSAGDCVVAQIQKDERILADHQLARPVRAEALRFLIHFVGDLHQPLHCADNHDRGGSEMRVLVGADESNLHAVWDTNVVAALGQKPDQVASGLAAQIAPGDETAWRRGSPVDWANESFGIAKSVIYATLPGEGGPTAPIVLPRDYAARQRPLTAVQLERAGVRLAVMLNTALGLPVHSAAVQTIAPQTASSHLGETVTVKGAVADVHTARSGVTFIDIGGRYPHNAFTAVIFSEDAAKFPDVGALAGKVVEITGLIRLYKGKPEIILSRERQLSSGRRLEDTGS